MRIVAGEWRGRRINAPPTMDVRPTADRVREAWMSIVQHDIPDARVVDLFAGSGALGLEALSRGAAWVDFIEHDLRTIRVLRENIASLGAEDRCAVHKLDAVKFAEKLAPVDGAPPYHLAFCDPPYKQGLAQAVAKVWLAEPFATIFCVEHSAFDPVPEGGDTRRYGDTALTIYRA